MGATAADQQPIYQIGNGPIESVPSDGARQVEAVDGFIRCNPQHRSYFVLRDNSLNASENCAILCMHSSRPGNIFQKDEQ